MLGPINQNVARDAQQRGLKKLAVAIYFRGFKSNKAFFFQKKKRKKKAIKLSDDMIDTDFQKSADKKMSQPMSILWLFYSLYVKAPEKCASFRYQCKYV